MGKTQRLNISIDREGPRVLLAVADAFGQSATFNVPRTAAETVGALLSAAAREELEPFPAYGFSVPGDLVTKGKP